MPSKKKPVDPHLAGNMANLRAEIEGFQAMTGKSEAWVSRLCGSKTLWHRLMVAKRPVRRETAELIRQRLAAWMADRRAEAERIRGWKGFIEVSRDGEPIELPDGMAPKHFRALVRIGYVAPAGDAMFGAPSQTYHPINFDDGAAAV